MKATSAASGELASGIAGMTSLGCQSRSEPSDLLEVDCLALVSQADLIYRSPTEMPVEGYPIGNGRMGTLIWTSPSSIDLQINRCDVFAVDNTHWGRQADSVDYCGGCARVSIEVGGGSPLRLASSSCKELLSTKRSAPSMETASACAASFPLRPISWSSRYQTSEKSHDLSWFFSLWREPELPSRDYAPLIT